MEISVTLKYAESLGQSGRFDEMKAVCRQVFDTFPNDLSFLLDLGALLSAFGLVSNACECLERTLQLAPDDFRATLNLANLERDQGNHAAANAQYAELLKCQPNHPVARRNVLVGMEYDPGVSDGGRFKQAKAWGEWANAMSGGYHSRPRMPGLIGRPLRVGYVSADFCQHTVGLFVKDVIKAHDPTCVVAYLYSAGKVDDWVTEELRQAANFRQVDDLNDRQLADRIRQDEIDVLVDLSGHTAGSRLTAFAHRPAPVLVSWLGYFATTGLPHVDAVLLDEWHAPNGTEAQFVEPIIRLPLGRLCYQPVPFAPDVQAPPCLERGYVTFGSFNNTGKYNADPEKDVG